MQRAVLHALQLAKEDIERWCGDLSHEQLNASPFGLPPVSFHLRHVPRSLDRLLTYAEGRELSSEQLLQLKTELAPGLTREDVLLEFNRGLENSARRVRAFNPDVFDDQRFVGKKRLPTTVAGLLVHVADHTQRHIGQAITTAKIVRQYGGT